MHLLHRRAVGEGQAGRGQQPPGRHHLPLGAPGAAQTEGGEGVRGDDAFQHHDLLLLQCAEQRAAALADEINNTADGRTARRERGGHRRIPRAHDDLLHVHTRGHLFHPSTRRGTVQGVLPVDELRLPLHFLFDPAHHSSQHLDVGLESGGFAPGSAGRQLLLHKLLLPRHQLLLFAGEDGLAGGDDAGGPLALLRGLFVQQLLLVTRRLLVCGGAEVGRVGVPIPTEERDSDRGLLQRSDVVASVATHQHVVPLALLQCADHLCLALGRHPRVHFDARDLIPQPPLRHRGSGLERRLGHHQVIALVHVPNFADVKRLPSAVLPNGLLPKHLPAVLGQQHRLRLAGANPNLLRHVQGCQGGIARQHGNRVVGVVQGVDDGLGVRAGLASEGDEAHKPQVALHERPGLHVSARLALLGRQRQYTHALLGHGLVRGIKPMGLGPREQETAHGLWRPLDQALHAFGHRARGIPDLADHGHALELGREMVPVQDAHREGHLRGLVLRGLQRVGHVPQLLDGLVLCGPLRHDADLLLQDVDRALLGLPVPGPRGVLVGLIPPLDPS
mmetsp:Transcript_38303/g.63551  ORF Transcript_38303/g.63551 Transcript_38303/m.63551 type:complete len:561 (-) Transcript_38303:1339-3021(-)